MIQFILMLLGLAFSHTNANTTTCNDNNGNPVTVQSSNPGSSLDPGCLEGDTGGDTIQIPPKK